jgi:hypothetical protein
MIFGEALGCHLAVFRALRLEDCQIGARFVVARCLELVGGSARWLDVDEAPPTGRLRQLRVAAQRRVNRNGNRASIGRRIPFPAYKASPFASVGRKDKPSPTSLSAPNPPRDTSRPGMVKPEGPQVEHRVFLQTVSPDSSSSNRRALLAIAGLRVAGRYGRRRAVQFVHPPIDPECLRRPFPWKSSLLLAAENSLLEALGVVPILIGGVLMTRLTLDLH